MLIELLPSGTACGMCSRKYTTVPVLETLQVLGTMGSFGRSGIRDRALASLQRAEEDGGISTVQSDQRESSGGGL